MEGNQMKRWGREGAIGLDAITCDERKTDPE
jgi:hypothetical protein